MRDGTKKSYKWVIVLDIEMKFPKNRPKFAVCIFNEDYPESLELRKLYQVLHDETAAKENLIRVIDESGEDYLYPSEWFISIDLPQTVEKTLMLVS